MVTEGEFRVWKIYNTDADTSITVKESKNCDSVIGDEHGETRVATTIERKPLITFHIPQYACTVEVSWSPAVAQLEWTRTSVLSDIWVGAGEKVPLYKTIRDHPSR